mgnify:CR=1 FL=1
MKRTQIIDFQGTKIFYMDFGNISSVEEIVSTMNESKDYIRRQPLGSVIALTNIGGMHFNNTIRDLFADFIKSNKPYIKHSAVVGVDGLKQIVYNGVMKITGRNVKAFSNASIAKSWLVSQN